MSTVDTRRENPLREVAALFLKLGIIAFGGPAVHVAMMHEEVVNRRKWIAREEFLDLVGATNLIPGPNSSELAIHLGHRRAGWPGLITAGLCFILPAACIITICAWAYVRYGSLPVTTALLSGVKPAIIAIVFHALWELGRTAIKSFLLALVSIAGIVLGFAGMNEILILLVAALVTALAHSLLSPRGHPGLRGTGMFSGFPILLAAQGAAVGSTPFSLGALFVFFVKVGSVLFGSGYVLLAFLRADLVERWQWLTESQLLDAIAIGQVTPGPVFTTATFIGYFLAGPVGATVATAGIFLPAFFFVAVSGPLIPLIRRSALAGAMLDGVNAASLSLMFVVTWQLGQSALVDIWSCLIALASAIVLFRYRPNPVWLVAGGAAAGNLLRWAGLVNAA